MLTFDILTACDSCVDALMMDLMTVQDELNLIKARLQSFNTSSRSLKQIRDLEARIQEVKVSAMEWCRL